MADQPAEPVSFPEPVPFFANHIQHHLTEDGYFVLEAFYLPNGWTPEHVERGEVRPHTTLAFPAAMARRLGEWLAGHEAFIRSHPIT